MWKIFKLVVSKVKRFQLKRKQNCFKLLQLLCLHLGHFKQAVTCLSEENSGGRSVKKLFFKSTFFKDVNFPINGGTLLSSLLQTLKALGFPFVALSKILSAISFPCEYCSQAQALPPGPQSFSDKTPARLLTKTAV